MDWIEPRSLTNNARKQNRKEIMTPALKDSPEVICLKKPDTGLAYAMCSVLKVSGNIINHTRLPAIMAQMIRVDFQTPVRNL
jgi:hypothetical protein